MVSPSRKVSSTGIATTINVVGDDLFQNIIGRLPATSFASAACVNRSWNRVCDRILCRPKLSSAWSINPSLQVAIEEVVNKVLSEPIRPHFAIAFVGRNVSTHEAHLLITAQLGFKVQLITSCSRGIIGTDVISDEWNELKTQDILSGQWNDLQTDDTSVLVAHISDRAIMLVAGFLPGIKVKIIPYLKQIETPQDVLIDKFVTDIREFSTSISGCKSPAAVIMFSEVQQDITAIMEKMEYALSSETVIVGGCGYFLRHANGSSRNITATEEHASAAALVFVVDKNKPPGIGETRFHSVVSSGLSSLGGGVYKVASVRAGYSESSTYITARREGSREVLGGHAIMSQLYEDVGDQYKDVPLCIGVKKRRKCSIGQEKVGWVTSFAFPQVLRTDHEGMTVGDPSNEIGDIGIKRGDTFRFYFPDFAAALSSATNVYNNLKIFKQGSTTSGNKNEVFGGLIFSSLNFGRSYFVQPNVGRSPFLDNFPGVTLGGTFCCLGIGRGNLTPYVKKSKQQKSARFCLPKCSDVYLIMSYTP